MTHASRLCTRRAFLRSAGAIGLSAVGCLDLSTATAGEDGLLSARPGQPSKTLGPGVHPLRLAWDRDGFIYVPTGYDPNRPAPLLMLLHGATQSSREWGVSAIYQAADAVGLVLVVPDSRGPTWDIVDGVFDADIRFIDKAFAHAFDSCNIDPKRVGLGGFSDGASCALSLGLPNGDFLSTVVAFSPGFLREPSRHGRPRVFIAHGTSDTVLPIYASTSIVEDLRADNYDVTFKEFSGGHVITLTNARLAFNLVATGTI